MSGGGGGGGWWRGKTATKVLVLSKYCTRARRIIFYNWKCKFGARQMTYHMIDMHITYTYMCCIEQRKICKTKRGRQRRNWGYAVFWEMFESISNNKIVVGWFICMKCVLNRCITLLDFNSCHNQHPQFSDMFFGVHKQHLNSSMFNFSIDM